MDRKLKLPADFERYSHARKGGFLRMKELKDSGVREKVELGELFELGRPVRFHSLGRYAGALGAALIAGDGKKER